ncbi:MAG: amidohydrolase family protein [Deltaproteobacteria bacterium]|jgi:predicted TIM-barrel fold metal-dependent hydrolase|nr:amidohydrolase family protein [Deltaproteobacteria bacterium]MBW2496062.1 amidohydrolase family protein [Deltaproteobacteria bacterium]
MSDHSTRSPAEIRRDLDHPVLDADGHVIEYWPAMDRALKEEGIEAGLAAFLTTANFDGSRTWQQLTPEERVRDRAYRSPWWGFPNDARDLATATAPRLMRERLDELGIDLAVVYPSIGLQLPAQRDEKVRRLGSRAYNRYIARLFEDLGDRLIPVAIIPTLTPEEALEELDFAVNELGLRAVVVGGFAARSFEDGDERAFWIDGLGLDSLYDYDPLWQRLVDHGIVASFHSGSMGWSGRRSTTNFSHNHMGNFAGASEATAKSLFFGGVMHRFPALRLAFLEGGVAWAIQMLVGLVEHYKKRGPVGLQDLDPSRIDGPLFDSLVSEYASELEPTSGFTEVLKNVVAPEDVVDDFAAAGIEGVDDICRQITGQCFFGCEADDPLAGLAYDTSRLPGRDPLRPIFSSDVGHWDVAHMHEVLPEAHEHLDHGWMDRDQFREFTCDNAIRMYTDANPDFFAGTVLEAHAKGIRGEDPRP